MMRRVAAGEETGCRLAAIRTFMRAESADFKRLRRRRRFYPRVCTPGAQKKKVEKVEKKKHLCYIKSGRKLKIMSEMK